MLDFSDTSFADFFVSEMKVNIDDPKFSANGGSKGKRLRYFLQNCDDATAIRALTALWEHRSEYLARPLPAWLLVAFFIVGAIGNAFASAEIAQDYRRWGYPDWFHYATAISELTTAGLLAFRRTRLGGVLLGSSVMLAAAATVLFHGEYSHAIAPLAVLCILVLVGWISVSGRRSRPSV